MVAYQGSAVLHPIPSAACGGLETQFFLLHEPLAAISHQGLNPFRSPGCRKHPAPLPTDCSVPAVQWAPALPQAWMQ